MKILLTGGSGLIGSALSRSLESDGHQIQYLSYSVNRKKVPDSVFPWDPVHGEINLPRTENFDAVVHLAGENIAGGRWTEERKHRIRETRVLGTHLLSETLSKMNNPPEVLVSASAVGYYGSRGEEILTENSERGDGFLADIGEQWELAAEPARRGGIRVVHPRIGIVLSKNGGALAAMLPLFRLGLGGPIGNGKQYMSWIDIDDIVRILRFTIDNNNISGPVNASSPNPVENREFAKTLGSVLNRPVVLPLPAFAAKLLLGQMAEELLLASQRMVPERLDQEGFLFQYPNLDSALRKILTEEESLLPISQW